MNSFDPIALECLAAIVEEGGFERAAQRLAITQSAVSQRLRTLESLVGTVLLVRTRPIRLTTAGQLLLKHTKMLRLIRADLERDLKELAPTTGGAREEERISIAINADSIATWALPALSGLALQGLPIEIIADDQDFTHERLREGQVLGCVTTLKAALRGCSVSPLGFMRYVAAASPELLAGKLAGQLLGHHNFGTLPFIAFNRKDDMAGEFISKAFGLKNVRLNKVFVPSSEGQVRALRSGWGVAVVPQLLVQTELDAGTLVDVCPDFVLPIALYWHCWNLESGVLDALTAALKKAAANQLETANLKQK